MLICIKSSRVTRKARHIGAEQAHELPRLGQGSPTCRRWYCCILGGNPSPQIDLDQRDSSSEFTADSAFAVCPHNLRMDCDCKIRQSPRETALAVKPFRLTAIWNRGEVFSPVVRAGRNAAMREMTVLVAVLAMVAPTGLGVLDAHAQTTPLPQTQPQLPTQSRELPSTTGRAQPRAPTGHRQPRASDVPREGEITVSPGDIGLDQLKICRGC